MDTKTAEKAIAQPHQGVDIPALNTYEIAALRELQQDEQLDFFGELVISERPEVANHARSNA